MPKPHVLLYRLKLELLTIRLLGYSDPYQVGLKETRQYTAVFDTVSEASGLIALQFTSIVKIVFHGVQRDWHIEFAGNNIPVWQTSSLARNTDMRSSIEERNFCDKTYQMNYVSNILYASFCFLKLSWITGWSLFITWGKNPSKMQFSVTMLYSQLSLHIHNFFVSYLA